MKKILVIEDNSNILENTAEILELSSYSVIKASNGKCGIEQALEHHPDLILCDIMMPELDGYGVLHMVQMNPALQQTPFIFLTAKTDPTDVRKGMSLGADDYIVKPFDPTDLLNAVERRLKKSAQLKECILEELASPQPVVKAEAALHNLVEGRHIDKYKKREKLFSEGNHAVRLYYIVKGKVKLFKTNEEGKEIIVRIAHDGEFFGHPALFLNALYHLSAEALEPSEIVTVPKSEFEELVRSNSDVAQLFIRVLSQNIIQRDEQLLNTAYNSLRRKVANALLTVYKSYATDNERLLINMSRENLAAVAGTATESLIRTLTDFKSEKLIDILGGQILILNHQRLEKMVN